MKYYFEIKYIEYKNLSIKSCSFINSDLINIGFGSHWWAMLDVCVKLRSTLDRLIISKKLKIKI